MGGGWTDCAMYICNEIDHVIVCIAGLANRVVAKGTALDTALELAQEIAAFPTECMRADRASLYHSVYSNDSLSEERDNWLKKALSFEFLNGVRIIQTESVPGAQSFASGTGRKGTF